MADYWDRNALLDEEKEEEEEDNPRIAGTFAGQSAADQVLGQEQLGATKTYDRTKLADPSANRKFHDAQFGNRKTIKGPNGEILHRDHAAAKRKYGADKWQNHAAEADHIDTLKNVHKRHGKNPFLTDQDIKEVANRQGNLQELSKRDNGPANKGEKSEVHMGWETRDPKQMMNGLKAQAETDIMLTGRAAKNAARVAHNSGVEVGRQAGMMAVTTAGISNMISVIKGEKTPAEALADTAKAGGASVAAGYVTGGGLEVVTQVLTNSSSKFLQSLSSANVPAKIITAVTLVGGTMKDYLTGKISTRECVTRLGETGLNVAVTGQAMLVGQALIPIPVVGAVVGTLFGSFLSSQLGSKVREALQRKDLEHQERLRLQAEYEKAEAQSRAFQRELESYLERYFQDCRACFDEALSEIHRAFRSGDSEGVVRGANMVTQKLGGTVQFNNRNEFLAYAWDSSTDIL